MRSCFRERQDRCKMHPLEQLMKRIVPTSSCLVAVLLTGSASAPGNSSSISVQHTVTIGFDPPDPVSATLFAVAQRCAVFDLYGLQATTDFSQGNSNSRISVGFDLLSGVQQGLETLVNGERPNLVPSVMPCENPVLSRIAYMSGEASAYVVHIGAGGPVVHKMQGDFTYCDRTVFVLPAAMTLEVPVRITGSVLAAESFGDPGSTYARATLSVQSSLGGLSETLAVESVTVIPEQASIDRTVMIPFVLPAGRSEITWSVTGHMEGEASAKGTGFIGSIAGAATLGVSFPGSIEVANFQLEGGLPLPAEVSIFSADGTRLYAGVIPEPRSWALAMATALGAFAVSRRIWRRRLT